MLTVLIIAICLAIGVMVGYLVSRSTYALKGSDEKFRYILSGVGGGFGGAVATGILLSYVPLLTAPVIIAEVLALLYVTNKIWKLFEERPNLKE